MNKSPPPSSLKNLQFSEDWNSHPAIEWLSAHKNILLWTLFAFIVALVLASRLITWRALDAEKDFFQAQVAFNQFQQAALIPNENSTADADLAQLNAIMQRHPELKPKYAGSLAQTFLINGQIPQAELLVREIFNRTQIDHLQFYQDYTQTSLVIGQGHYAAALQRAQHLKLSLDELGEGFNPILYIFNLTRLAMLYQQTHQPQEELKTWEEIQNQPQRLKAFLATNEALKVGQVSLNQYIEERKSALISKSKI